MSEERWRLRFEVLERAYLQLDQACRLESYSDLELAGLLQTYQFTFELAWKTMKDLLSFQGIDANSPREVIKGAFAAGLLGDADLWLEALGSRNRLTLTYDAAMADEAKLLIKTIYAPMIGEAVSLLRTRSLVEND
jgi:nucleotidyltransferase substrate binding protein (TIGR01987 family)